MAEPTQSNPHAAKPKTWPLWAVLALLCAGYLTGLGRRDIWVNAEARVLLTARDMFEGGSWLCPTMQGKPRYEKPPLMYWATAAVARVQGELRATSAFWVSALASVAAILALAGGVALLGGARAGAVAGLMLAASPGVFSYGRQAQIDALFMACCTLSVVGFALWIFRPTRWSAAWVVVAGFFWRWPPWPRGPTP
jgi:4-amino-4-deoxy-L-arabinose transferase-like glycosyltransferase